MMVYQLRRKVRSFGANLAKRFDFNSKFVEKSNLKGIKSYPFGENNE